jgi:GH24 family phage-related lysozyme (muramidase)
MLMQPTTIAAAQAAGSPYFWDNGQKKLAVTAEQLAQFKAGGQYDPTGGSALTQWANMQTQPINPNMINTQMDLQPRLDINPVPTEPSMMDRARGFVSGLIPEGRTKSGVVDPSEDWVDKTINWGRKYLPNILVPDEPYTSAIGELTVNRQRAGSPAGKGRIAPVSYSQVAMDKIAEWEGFRDTPYDDVGTQRIGYGREAGSDKTTTVESERGDLMTKIQDIGDWLDGVVTADLNANQKAALTSLVYNVGKGSFKKSKALKALNKGDMDEFRSQAFSKNKGWVKSKGKFLQGLYNRRMKEQALFDG